MKSWIILLTLSVLGLQAANGQGKWRYCGPSRSGSYSSIYTPYQYTPPQRKVAAPAPKRDLSKCTIVVLLPSKPCDLYVEGTLIKSGAADKVEMVTPGLSSGTFKYTLTLRDSKDYNKTKDHIVNGIVAGGNITVDLRTIELASL